MSATETVTLNVTGNAVQQLQKIETQLGKLGSKFLGLKNVLGGFALGNFAANTLKFADSIQDLSNATGLATASILGFGRAVQLNGGDLEGANTAMNKFILSINEAAEGGAKSQLAFQKIGVSLQDLSTLTEQQLFDKVVKGLAQIKDKSEAAAIANELFGKSIRGVDFSKLAGDYSKATQQSAKYSESIKKGAETQQEIETAINNLKLALLTVLQPVGQLAKAINDNAESFSKWIQIAWEVVKVIGSLFLIGKLFTVISRGINFVRGLWFEWKLLKLSLKEVQTQTVLTNNGIFKAIQGIEKFIKKNPDLAKFREQFVRIRDGVQTAGMAVIGFIGAITGLTAAYQKYKQLTEDTDFTKPLVIQGEGAEPIPEDYFKNRREQIRQVQEANEKLNNSIKDVRISYERNREASEAAAAAEIGFAMMATDTADQIRAQQKAYDDIINAVDDLRKKKQDLGKDNQAQKALIDQEIAALLATIPAATEAARARVEALQGVKNAQADVLKQTELMKMQLENDLNITQLQDQIALLGMVGDELEDNQIIMEVSQQLEQTLIELRKQELDLIAKKGQMTDEQFQKELDHINQLRIAASEKANKELDAKRQVKEAQRTADEDASLGIKKYLDELEKGVTPAKRALDSVQSVFGNMSSALETFVKTGKFKFKDFALSVIQDLILIQAKAAMTQIFSSILKGIGLFGKAEGGPVKGNMPYIVGEKGPELFVPNSSGTIVPNNKMQGAGSPVSGQQNVTNVVYNISAVDAKSVAQLFAENRKSLLGATRMAEKEMPYAGRM